MVETRSLWKTAFLGGALVYFVPTFYLARLPWMRSHSLPALAGVLAALGLCYWLYYVERRSQPATDRPAWSTWSGRLAYFLGGSCLAWILILQGGHWRYLRAEAAVARSGLRPELPPDDVQDQSDRNGQMILLRLADDKDFKVAFKTDKPKNNLPLVIDTALNAAAGRQPGLNSALEALRERRHQWQPALKALRQAQAAPIFSWNVRYSVNFNQIEIPRYAHVRNIVRAACAEALLLEAAGDGTGAEAQLKRAQWLIDKVSGPRTLLATNVASAAQGLIYDAGTPLFKKGAGQALFGSHEIGDLEQGFHQAMRFELLYLPPAVRGMVYGETTGSGGGYGRALLGRLVLPWLNWDMAGCLVTNLAVLDCLDAPLMEANACLKAQSESIARNGWTLQAPGWPNFDQMLLKVATTTARQEIAYLSRKAGSFRKATHRWPSGFSDLPQLREMPDPFTGQPMITRVKNGHFELICVGSDGKEDGEKPGDGSARDIVVRF
jgi:hypothetical protein